MRAKKPPRRPVLLLMAATCLMLGAAPASTEGPDCRFNGPHDEVLDDLLTCDEDALQELFRSLPAGRMPGWDVSARGHWRTWPAGPDIDGPFDTLVNQFVWHGKAFYTDRQGGILFNRVFGDRSGFPAVVEYGPARLDGRPAIIVDYEKADDPLALFFRDEIRQVTQHLYLGFGWWNHEPDGWPGPDHITFILDFRNPDLSTQDCLACLTNPDGW